MARGGKREGAGRKPVSHEIEYAFYLIGSWCDRFQNRLVDCRVHKEVKKRTPARSEYHVELYKRSLEDRAQGLSELDMDNWQFAVREDRKIDANEDDIPSEKLAELIRIPKVRPKGARPRILIAAQRMILKKYDVALSVFTIADYWKRYRKWQLNRDKSDSF
jgi:hypothetical protein